MGVSVAEEGGLPTTEFTNQFGLKTLHGIPKPAWRAFQLAHEHAGELRLPLTVTEHRPPPPPPAPVPPPPPQGSCVVESSKRCFGDDILPDADHLLLPDPDSCCRACWNHTTPLQCSSWTYAHASAPPGIRGRCYLKTALDGCTDDAAFTSGTTHNSEPPVPYDGNAVTAFATQSATGDETAVFLGYWSNSAAGTFTVDRTVTIQLAGHTGPTSATEYRIDRQHANPAKAWRAMGSPAVPSQQQLDELVQSSEVEPTALTLIDGKPSTTVNMTNNSAVLIVFKHSGGGR